MVSASTVGAVLFRAGGTAAGDKPRPTRSGEVGPALRDLAWLAGFADTGRISEVVDEAVDRARPVDHAQGDAEDRSGRRGHCR